QDPPAVDSLRRGVAAPRTDQPGGSDLLPASSRASRAREDARPTTRALRERRPGGEDALPCPRTRVAAAQPRGRRLPRDLPRLSAARRPRNAPEDVQRRPEAHARRRDRDQGDDAPAPDGRPAPAPRPEGARARARIRG